MLRPVLAVVLLVLACGGGGGAGEGGSEPVLGKPCDHDGDLEFTAQRFSHDQNSCAGEVCAFAPIVNNYIDSCAQDSECNQTNPMQNYFACVAGTCELRDEEKLARSMCATPCSVDAECNAAADGTTCVGGFVCARSKRTCCESYCLCSDDFRKGMVDAGEADCQKPLEIGDCEL